MKTFRYILVSGVLLNAFAAHAASFDCARGHSAAERVICHDAALSSLDDQLGKLYRQARRTAPNRRAFTADSDAKWAWREANCTDAACLTTWYTGRIADLQKLVAETPARPQTQPQPQAQIQTPPQPAHAAVPAPAAHPVAHAAAPAAVTAAPSAPGAAGVAVPVPVVTAAVAAPAHPVPPAQTPPKPQPQAKPHAEPAAQAAPAHQAAASKTVVEGAVEGTAKTHGAAGTPDAHASNHAQPVEKTVAQAAPATADKAVEQAAPKTTPKAPSKPVAKTASRAAATTLASADLQQCTATDPVLNVPEQCPSMMKHRKYRQGGGDSSNRDWFCGVAMLDAAPTQTASAD
ncbi:hypothetical protein [Paraburkholderia sp.]|uniref:lysozyme inhibitor LprI family protein n=1 Tax=Paraburkholderia sp. TaxID=1926495 RepID=UPI0023A73483|nr:hypothetical protein [Paraburkholderia sp.]MDE1183877.1 hypothetical protein [Paraburkholderia sp.]